ncbi:MAG: hypothetical protein J7M24_01310, partial [Candidatus Latescibacteria bacterium]|nr:hypothetical protein [Candidatus Latescibacterota bacterium]
LFANAAEVKTRLVDIAGKFGPLKLTGHYFCESWDQESHKWYLVDPMSGVGWVRTAGGRLLNTLEIKRLFDVDEMGRCRTLSYDRGTRSLAERDIERYYAGNRGYFTGEIVLAYKFGYPKNASYSKLVHFVKYPTLLYAPFALPNLYAVKRICIAGLAAGIAGMFAVGFFVIAAGRNETVNSDA